MVGVAVKVTEAPTHIAVELAAIFTDGVTDGVTVIAIELDVAGEPVAQVKLDVMITVTTSPFANEVVVNVEEFAPALTPFNCHWYEGAAPPFVGTAVNVTDVPAQIEVDVELIFTDAGPGGTTIIVIELDVTGEPVAQLKLEVKITVTTSPLTKVLVV